MFYDNAINRLNGKKRRPHYTTLKKTIPEGPSLDSEPNQSKIYFFLLLLLLRGLKKYDMSISQTPKRVNLSYGWNNFLQVRNDGDFISSILDHTKDALTEILLLKTKYRIMS